MGLGNGITIIITLQTFINIEGTGFDLKGCYVSAGLIKRSMTPVYVHIETPLSLKTIL
jgi:hypothetical protein